MTSACRLCVCVPARDEAERLPRLVEALAAQDWASPLHVVVALNNTTDRSRDVLTGLACKHAERLVLHIDEATFPVAQAHAGSARRRAMEVGLSILGDDKSAVLLTTDADAHPPEHWVSSNIAAIERGLDIVGGALILDDEHAPDIVRARWFALAAYWREVRRIEDALDPVSWDPPPRHGDHTGASLATTVAAYRTASGFPAIAVGEDRAFVTAARQAGFRLAHPQDVWTRVSPRVAARVVGGMATVMASLAERVSTAMIVPSLEQWRERAHWRRTVRFEPNGGDARVAWLEAELPPMVCDVVIAAAVEANAA